MAEISICFVGLENLPALSPEYRNEQMGGAQIQQTLLAKALARRGARVSMVVADYGQPDGAQWDAVTTFKAYKRDAGLPVVRFVYPRWTSVWSAMRRSAASIYYVSCAGMLLGEVAWFARRRGAKTVFRIAHDTDCRPAELLIPTARDKWLYRQGLANTNLVLAQSATQQREMKVNFGLDSTVIPSLQEASDVNLPLRDREIDVLWVSNIRPFKRPEIALEFAANYPRVTLHMVGGTQPGQLQYFDAIKACASRLPNVVFHGAMSNDRVNQYISKARLLINTSESEGFPNTYLQSWTRGTPVVGLFDPDNVIDRHRLGLTARNAKELQSAVISLLGDTIAWSAASERCIAYVRDRHGESAVGQYWAALQSL